MVQRTDRACEGLNAELEGLREHVAELEAAAVESEERWRSLLENAPGVIVAAEPDGRVTFVNRTFSGVPPERVVGTSVFDHVLPEHRQTLQDALDRAVLGGETVTYELVGSPPGASIPVESRVGPLERGGRTVGVTIISSDITERKRAEEERRSLEASLQSAQRLESLGILAGGIAHDFNNLLVAILGNADLALVDIAPHAPYRGWIEQIKLAARRASELTNQMLIYSGQGTYVADPLDLNLLVEEMGDLLRVSISHKIALRHECSAEVPFVIADASQMRQVVMNLIMNASEAIGDESGTVSIRITEVEVDQEIPPRMYIGADLPAGRYLSPEVADTGCGMEAVTRSKLFDPFFTTKFAGRGLGLAAVLGIVRAHRGAIEVKSQVNEGSTFRILLPAVESRGAAGSEEHGSRSQDWREGGTILVAEDDEGVRDVAKEMLERAGFTVISAADGREAVRIFRAVSEEIDAVLLDLTMPHMDGGEVLRELRRLRPDVKVILCSGYMEGRARELCDEGEQLSFVQKPFELETLLGALREVLAPGSGT
jgi:PAS domain S-box-containing protein